MHQGISPAPFRQTASGILTCFTAHPHPAASVAVQVMRRYHIQDRDDYKRYNRLVGQVTALVHRLRGLDATDATRIELTDQVLDK